MFEENHEKVLNRILALSDGVFAFAITLLILNVTLPDGTTTGELGPALLGLWPKYFAFVLSFAVIGLFWIKHVKQWRLLQKYNGGLIWINFLFLLFIVLMPFSTSILSNHTGSLPTIVYAANIACAGYVSTILWAYTAKTRLVNSGLGSRHIKRGIILSLIAPAVFTLSTGIALIDSTAAQFSWLSIFIFEIVAQRLLKLPKAKEII